MKVSRILQNKGGDVATVTPETPILEVVAEMRSRGIGAMVVTDPDGGIAGILSERDIVQSLADHGEGLAQLSARDLMTSEVSVCDSNHDVNDVMRQMSGGRFRHVPVVEQGKVSGVISIGDVVRARIDELERETEALQHYISG